MPGASSYDNFTYQTYKHILFFEHSWHLKDCSFLCLRFRLQTITLQKSLFFKNTRPRQGDSTGFFPMASPRAQAAAGYPHHDRDRSAGSMCQCLDDLDDGSAEVGLDKEDKFTARHTGIIP